MKSKLVLWGTDAQENRVLIAMQLRAADNKVDVWMFPEAIASPDFSQRLHTDWRDDAAEVAFPEGGTHIEKELSITDNLLPDTVRVERKDLVARAQTEWHFMVLSTKLHAAYRSELAELEDRIGKLSDYSHDSWETLKGFWGKVQNQVSDRNLFRDHADELRETTNGLFGRLKDMRTTVMNEFEESSKTWYSQLNTILDDIETKAEKGVQLFPEIFEQLKQAQVTFRKQKMTRDHSNELWNRIDGLFKAVKLKNFGTEVIQDTTIVERMVRRFEGLIGAIDKMQDSIDRDQQELDFHRRRVAHSDGQLETQIREAKIKMIQERVKSKDEKLAEMLATKAEIESKIAVIEEQDARKAAADAKAAAKAEAKRLQKAEARVEKVAEMPAALALVATPLTCPDSSGVSVSKNGHADVKDIAANAHAAVEAVEGIFA